MKYNHYFANHFGGCLLLAKAYDPHRDRQVELRMLPGEFDVVGVSDGTDAWIAPVSGDPFSVSVKRILEDIRNGKMPHQTKPRHRVLVAVDEASSSGAQKPRQRVLFIEPTPEPTPTTTIRRRAHVHP